MSVGDLEAEDFRSLEGPLQVIDAALTSALSLQVESVTALPAHAYRAAPFSVILAGPATPALAQGSFTLRHPVKGDLQLFLVPISRDAAATRYELTFN